MTLAGPLFFRLMGIWLDVDNVAAFMWGDTRGAPLFSVDGYSAGCRYVAALCGVKLAGPLFVRLMGIWPDVDNVAALCGVTLAGPLFFRLMGIWLDVDTLLL